MPDFQTRLPAMISLLKRLVESESPSHDKAAVDRLGTQVKEECLRLGGDIKMHPQVGVGDLIEAKFEAGRHPFLHPPYGDTSPLGEMGVLLLSHMDTVFPVGTLAKMPFYEQAGKVYGPGTMDMKGGIVVALAAISAALESGKLHRPITALFTSDEETGSAGSRPLIEALAREAALVLVLEPGLPDGSVKTWRKGVGDFTVTVHGRAAHAGGDHEKGRNAIEEMAHQVLAIQKMTDYSKGTTLNVGVIHGGTVINVVPAEAVIQVDLRVMQPGEAERILAALKALKPVLAGTSLAVSGELNRPPMPFDGTMKATFEKAKAIAAKSGLEIKAGGTGGASDANFVAPLGIPVLDGLGPAGDGEHSEREFIFKDSLVERARLLETLLCEW
jgi:glutamate carboxypeptidase